jgi:hypothetical protein
VSLRCSIGEAAADFPCAPLQQQAFPENNIPIISYLYRLFFLRKAKSRSRTWLQLGFRSSIDANVVAAATHPNTPHAARAGTPFAGEYIVLFKENVADFEAVTDR